MASQNKINLIKIKNHLQNKNFKIGGFLNFKSDASEKIFKLCKTANQSLLVLSFLNKPSDYQKYINCLLYTSPSPRDRQKSRMPSSA